MLKKGLFGKFPVKLTHCLGSSYGEIWVWPGPVIVALFLGSLHLYSHPK